MNDCNIIEIEKDFNESTNGVKDFSFEFGLLGSRNDGLKTQAMTMSIPSMVHRRTSTQQGDYPRPNHINFDNDSLIAKRGLLESPMTQYRQRGGKKSCRAESIEEFEETEGTARSRFEANMSTALGAIRLPSTLGPLPKTSHKQHRIKIGVGNIVHNSNITHKNHLYQESLISREQSNLSQLPKPMSRGVYSKKSNRADTRTITPLIQNALHF